MNIRAEQDARVLSGQVTGRASRGSASTGSASEGGTGSGERVCRKLGPMFASVIVYEHPSGERVHQRGQRRIDGESLQVQLPRDGHGKEAKDIPDLHHHQLVEARKTKRTSGIKQANGELEGAGGQNITYNI